MKTEMNINELEQVNGGNFLDDVKGYLKKIFNPTKPEPIIPNIPDPFVPETPIVPDLPFARG